MSKKFSIPVSTRQKTLIGSVIDSSTALLAEQKHDIVRFAMGAPSDDLMPVAQLDECLAETVAGRYDYGETEGEPVLREEIIKLSQKLGVKTADERLVVTSGGMQGLDLAFKLFVDPGDLVIVEAPTYTNGYATALSYGADVLPAPVDDNGLVVEALPELVAKTNKTPRAIYTIPNFQNPTGVSLTERRRVMLLELAEEWGAVIVDDDPYGALRFAGESIKGFAEIAPNHPLIFQVRTFSKIISPGLRLGWIDTDPEIQKLAINAKQAMDTCTSVPIQQGVAKFLTAGYLAEHVDRLLPLYKERKNAMRESLQKHFGDNVSATDPDGGFFLWVKFQNELAEVDTEDLFPTALQEGVAYIPGPAFTIDESMRSDLRLCFATSTPARIEEGVARLAKAVALKK